MTNSGLPSPLEPSREPPIRGQAASRLLAKPPYNGTFLRNVRYRNGRQCPNPETPRKVKEQVTGQLPDPGPGSTVDGGSRPRLDGSSRPGSTGAAVPARRGQPSRLDGAAQPHLSLAAHLKLFSPVTAPAPALLSGVPRAPGVA